ncbi:hypothetical protein CIG19_01890 [Enterobacterales bacterium CwR94]|nr:hypothetical protein CIG19_01890 [Enterobacterales bacterium CwR94]
MSVSPVAGSTPRLGGWLLLPLAWLILSFLASTLAVANYVAALLHPALRDAIFSLTESFAWGFLLSLVLAIAMWCFTCWVTWLFCLRSQRLPRFYILWLLVSILFSLRSFMFNPVTDGIAVQNLLMTLAAAALIVPYFKRSQRVKNTFVAR